MYLYVFTAGMTSSHQEESEMVTLTKSADKSTRSTTGTRRRGGTAARAGAKKEGAEEEVEEDVAAGEAGAAA